MGTRITNDIVDEKIRPRNIARVSEVASYHKDVTWVCKTCNTTWMATPNNVINRNTGCPACSKERVITINKSRQLSREEFVARAARVHGDKYYYSDVHYVGSATQVVIICPTHGKFKQTPNKHLCGSGCPLCGQQKSQVHNNTLKEQAKQAFVLKATAVHNNVYDYTRVDYVNNRTKVDILCATHGMFKQTPTKHLSGTGCPECGRAKLRGHYTETYFEKYPEEKTCEGWVYVVVMNDGGVLYVKLGITKQRDVRKRLHQYNNVVNVSSVVKKENLYEAFKIEQQTLKLLSEFKYVPIQKFGGHTECLQFSDATIQRIEEEIA